MTCYDWDPDNFQVDDAEIVFEPDNLAKRPAASGKAPIPADFARHCIRSRLFETT